MLASYITVRARKHRRGNFTYGLQREKYRRLKGKKNKCPVPDFLVYGTLEALFEFVMGGDSSHRNCGEDRKPCHISTVWIRSFTDASSPD